MNPRLKISDGAPARPGPLSAEPARHIHQCLRWPGPGGPGTGVYNEMRHGGAHVPPGQPLSEGGWSLAGLSANPYVERGPEVAQALASMGKLQKLKKCTVPTLSSRARGLDFRLGSCFFLCSVPCSWTKPCPPANPALTPQPCGPRSLPPLGTPVPRTQGHLTQNTNGRKPV